MSELMFIVKSLVMTFLLTVLMQVKVGDSSLERQAQWYLQRSPVSIYVQSVAAGGALALRNLYVSVKSGVMESADSYRQGSKAQAGK